MLLNDLKITKTKPGPTEIRLADGEGLHLAILPNGRRFWRWDYTYHGRRKQLSFGKYPIVTLKRAREKKLEAQRLLDAGTDPSAARKREKVAAAVDTFAAIATEWLDREAASLGVTGTKPLDPDTVAKKRGQLDRYLVPALGAMPIATIASTDVWPLLQAIERLGKRETAHGVRRIASKIFRYAITTGRRKDADPAAYLGDALKPVHTRNHPSLLQPVKVARLLDDIDHAEGSPFVIAALRLAPLVWVRPGELRHARWEEFDLDGTDNPVGAPMWRIPAARMKPAPDRIDHLVPLSTQAIAILRDLATVAGDNPLLFPGVRTTSEPISDATLGVVLRRLGYSKDVQSVHGFRTLASTHLRELRWEGDLVELQLSHKIENRVRAAYDKAARVPERVAMMQAWANHLDDVKAGRVVAFTGRVLEFRGAAPAAIAAMAG